MTKHLPSTKLIISLLALSLIFAPIMSCSTDEPIKKEEAQEKNKKETEEKQTSEEEQEDKKEKEQDEPNKEKEEIKTEDEKSDPSKEEDPKEEEESKKEEEETKPLDKKQESNKEQEEPKKEKEEPKKEEEFPAVDEDDPSMAIDVVAGSEPEADKPKKKTKIEGGLKKKLEDSSDKDEEDKKDEAEKKRKEEEGKRKKDKEDKDKDKERERKEREEAERKERERKEREEAERKERERKERERKEREEAERKERERREREEAERREREEAERRRQEEEEKRRREEANRGFELADIKKPLYGGDLAIAMKFTGQKCQPCSSVASLWENGPRQYRNLIVVNLHPFTGYSPSNGPCYSSQASSYANSFGVSGIPSIFANGKGRTVNSPSGLSSYMNRSPIMSSTVRYKLEGNELTVRVKSENVNGNNYRSAKAVFWVIEDGITGYQVNYGMRYVHNHLFRSAPLGLWGEQYNVGSTQDFSFSLPYNIKNRQNVQIVYMLMDNSYRVLYVTKFAI